MMTRRPDFDNDNNEDVPDPMQQQPDGVRRQGLTATPPPQLQHELDGEQGSFILKLRVDLCWEPQHVLTLLKQMYEYIISVENAAQLNRKTAGELWFVIHFIQNWSSHEAFRHANPYPDDYYRDVYELLFMLGDWYFTGECPYTNPGSMLDEIRSLEQGNG